MNITNQRHPADDRLGRTPHDEDVPVRTRIWCTAAMIPLACLMNVVFTSLASQQCPADDPGYWWYVLALFVSMASGFVLLARAYHPEIRLFGGLCGWVIRGIVDGLGDFPL